MTRTTNARIAGFTFLFYIAVGITSMVLNARATSGEGFAAQLATMAQHATDVRLAVLLIPFMNLSALVLAVTLYAITREQDPDLAMLAMICRVAEGIAGMDVSKTLGLLWLATAADGNAPDVGGAPALGAFLLKTEEWSAIPSATFFALGSTLFSWLLLRGRMIPVALAWLGVLASILVVVCLPLQLAGVLGDPVTWFMWLPILLFEVALALWLIVKGVASPASRRPA
ncbi:MAG TPA: DUF4386 domain-containing protein [Vicinamibacterales bacterium]|nr:DUF4386 domain-containing protein [Vicinamibacterales bacterium]